MASKRASDDRRKGEIQGSLHCGGKSAAFGRDDVVYGQREMKMGSIGMTWF
jgi:hypothetical protein